jgi:hypothetical protein
VSARFRLTRKFLLPAHFTAGEGQLLGWALDVQKDEFMQRVYLGLLARFPETAPDDALPVHGRMRKVIRGIGESRTSYIGRLLLWLDDRKTAGNPFSLMDKLAEYTGPGCKFRTVDASGNWYTRNVDGTFSVLLSQANWDWDSQNNPTPNRWSRFWVIIYPSSLWTNAIGNWGSSTAGWGSGVDWSWGSTAPREQVATIRALVGGWKPEGTRCVNIIVAFDSASFDPSSPEPDGFWGKWHKVVAGVAVPARLATARYWDGVS